MQLNTQITASGCITKENALRGRTLADIERILGFHIGRLSQGMVVAALTQVPQPNQFEFAGYTQVAGHHFQEQYGKVAFDKDLMKKKVIAEVFKTHGPDRLVKVMPNIPHSDLMPNDDQYPPGLGVPQWKLTARLPAMVVAIVTDYPNGKY